MSRKNADRDHAIYAAWASGAYRSQAQIGKVYGLGKSRVSQIVQRVDREKEEARRHGLQEVFYRLAAEVARHRTATEEILEEARSRRTA